MYPAGLCERWAGFFWQLPLLVYIIWLNFLPMTSLAPCYTTCGVRENPPSHTHIMQPPRSFYIFLILPLSPPGFPPDLRARQPSLHHLRPCFFLSLDQVFSPLFFLCSLTSPLPIHFIPTSILPSSHVKTPASCGLFSAWVFVCASMNHASCYLASMPLYSYILKMHSLLVNVLRTVVY